jgi:predicted solute-binding protein
MKVRIGIVGYLNAHPLTDGLDRGRFDVISNHPSVIAGMLRRGDVDVALCPVAAVLHDDQYQVVPGWCIASEGPVTSVLIVAEGPPESWTKVVLDGVSRTSVVLARLLLTKGPLSALVRPDLEIVDGPPGCGVDAACGSVAAVVIGDVARQLPDRLTHRVDLASAWREWTGLPFVFAVWAARPGVEPEVVEAIRASGAAGVSAIADRYQGADLSYLRDALRYPLDDRALMGLRRFAALGHAAGLLSRDDVDLVGPAVTWRPRVDVDAVLARAEQGLRLDRADALALWREASLADLAWVADQRRQELHPGPTVPFVLRATGADHDALIAAGASVLVLTGQPTVERVRALASRHPGVRLQGAVPGVDDLRGLGDAGLDLLHDDPVGLLVDPARMATLSAAWEQAAGEGLRVVATLVVGQGESVEDRLDTLLALRDAQDRFGLFDAARVWAAFGDGPAGSEANTATDHLRAVAMARLVLDNVPRMMAAPDTEGLGMAQASLRMGCDHLGFFSVEDVSRIPALLADIDHVVAVAGYTAALEGPVPRPVRSGSDRRASW